MRITSLLSDKKASGSIYLGFMIMIVAFVAILVCVNLFQLYTLNTQVQIISDAIADGAASAGLTMFSFDETKMREAANEIFKYNDSISGLDLNYSISVENEVDRNGHSTNNKLITVEVFGRKQAFNSGLIEAFTNADADNEYAAMGRAVVRAEVKTVENSWIDDTILKKPESYELPFAPTEIGKRNANYVNWLVDYYLCPAYNPVYQKPETSVITRADWLLYDYLVCMGIPGMRADFGNFSHVLEDLITNQPSATFSNWVRFANVKDIQKNADAGKPTIIICETLHGQWETYIVVPQKNTLQDGEIAVAYANEKRSNYNVLNWNEFCKVHQNIFSLGYE